MESQSESIFFRPESESESLEIHRLRSPDHLISTASGFLKSRCQLMLASFAPRALSPTNLNNYMTKVVKDAPFALRVTDIHIGWL